MREPYICPHCNHRSTRRWNLDVHIKRKHGEYLVERSLDVMANNLPLYNHSIHLRNARVADSVGYRFQPSYIPEQTPLAVSPNFANPIYPHISTTDGQSYGTGLSPETILKIAELKRLVNKYPQFHTIDADEIVKW